MPLCCAFWSSSLVTPTGWEAGRHAGVKWIYCWKVIARKTEINLFREIQSPQAYPMKHSLSKCSNRWSRSEIGGPQLLHTLEQTNSPNPSFLGVVSEPAETLPADPHHPNTFLRNTHNGDCLGVLHCGRYGQSRHRVLI